MKNTVRNISVKLGCAMARIIPVIATVMLVMHVNSSASTINGQPKMPEGLKKYRKF